MARWQAMAEAYLAEDAGHRQGLPRSDDAAEYWLDID
jgi:hypothetical protein